MENKVTCKDGTILTREETYTEEEWGDILFKKEMEIRDACEKPIELPKNPIIPEKTLDNSE